MAWINSTKSTSSRVVFFFFKLWALLPAFQSLKKLNSIPYLTPISHCHTSFAAHKRTPKVAITILHKSTPICGTAEVYHGK
jgi:hypothetical protein